LYDKYGLEGVKRGGGGGMDDIFEMFTQGGGRGGRGGQKQKKKVQPTEKEITVTLEDIFQGKMIKLDHEKTSLCNDCSGKGGEGVQECKDCGGRGIVLKMQQLGPGMYTQTQAHCPKCKGQGEVYRVECRSSTKKRSVRPAKERKSAKQPRK
jgi:DnaJ-class molecular chaperone